MIIKTIKGFPIKTKSDNNIIIGHTSPERFENINEEPRMTKNIKTKKSLKERTFAEIWKFSEEFTKENPAKNPPISMEKPAFDAIIATPKHHAKLLKNKSSCERAILSKSRRRIFLPKKSIKANRMAPLISATKIPETAKLPLP